LTDGSGAAQGAGGDTHGGAAGTTPGGANGGETTSPWDDIGVPSMVRSDILPVSLAANPVTQELIVAVSVHDPMYARSPSR
jgi:hypothetical protein